MKANAIELSLNQRISSVGIPRVVMLSPIFAVAALLASFADLYVARLSLLHAAPGDVRKALAMCEIFGHGFGIAVICLTIAVLDQANRRKLPRLLACAFLPGLAAVLIKTAVGRRRPHSYLEASSMKLPGHIWESFVGWFPGLANGNDPLWSAHSIQSFPSGHTATAVGFAIGLAWLYPRGKWLFRAFAVLVALQRIESGAHFVSDTLAAAALACLIAGTCLDKRRWGRWFVRWEQRANTPVESQLS